MDARSNAPFKQSSLERFASDIEEADSCLTSNKGNELNNKIKMTLAKGRSESVRNGGSKCQTRLSSEILFHRQSSMLVPVVISLQTNLSTDSYLFVKDYSQVEDVEWQLAQMCAKHTQLASSFFSAVQSETVLAVIIRCLMANMSANHPIHRLLVSTLSEALDEKEFAKSHCSKIGIELQNDNDRYFLKNFHYKDWNLRGTLGDIFAYSSGECRSHDNLFLLWVKYEQLVKGLVELYYETNEEIEKDDELTNVLIEISNIFHDNGAEFPAILSTRTALVDLLVSLVFHSTVILPTLKETVFLQGVYVPNAPPFIGPTVKLFSTLKSQLNPNSSTIYKCFKNILPEEVDAKLYIRELRSWSKQHVRKVSACKFYLSLIRPKNE